MKAAAQTVAHTPSLPHPDRIKGSPAVERTAMAAPLPSPFRHPPTVAAPPAPNQDDAVENDLLSSVLAQVGTPLPDRRSDDPQSHTDQPFNWDLPGFGRGCRVATLFGDLPIEALRRRDKVKTLSGAYQEVVWIDEIRLDADFMARHPEAHPVQLRSKALGPGQPDKSILVSPAQSLCANGRAGDPTPVQMADLIGTPGVHRFPKPEMTYYLFHCGSPETVSIEGVWFPVIP